MRVAGHELRMEGAPFNDAGVWNWPYRRTGPGRGLCSCGDLSEELPSAAARKRWHRAHKEQVKKAAER